MSKSMSDPAGDEADWARQQQLVVGRVQSSIGANQSQDPDPLAVQKMWVEQQAGRDLAYQREIKSLRAQIADTVLTRSPETLAVVNARVTALLKQDGERDGATIPLRPETLQELSVLTSLIHELR